MNTALRDRLLRNIKCSVKLKEPLAPYTTFRIGGPAEIFAEPATQGELAALMNLIREEQAPYFYLGLGSNLLISDSGFTGIVIRSRGELEEISQQDRKSVV